HQALAEELITPSYASLLMGEELPTSTREITQTALSQAAKSLAAFYATDPELIEFTEADLLDDVTAKNS
ncbi:MAG: hypothetical protein GX998_05195, partial [Firmicutes bacterium]|nr:hypothetical protein [Bacillota bacterium]